MVPVQGLGEFLGAEVEFLESEGKVVVANEVNRIELAIDQAEAIVNGESQSVEVPACTLGNNIMIPLRFVCEALNAQVNWLPEERKVVITLASEKKPREENIKVGNFVYSPDSLTVTGTARIWEANVVYELVDGDGNVLFDGFTTASIGAPEWGDYSFAINGDLSQAETIRIFSISAKDGSKMDMVEYYVKPMGKAKILETNPDSILVEGELGGYSVQPVQFIFSLTEDTIINDSANEPLAQEELKIGDQIEIWITYPGLVLESWPARAAASKVVKVSE
jgi:hypothetical protein